MEQLIATTHKKNLEQQTDRAKTPLKLKDIWAILGPTSTQLKQETKEPSDDKGRRD